MNQMLRGSVYESAAVAGALFVVSSLTACSRGQQAARAAPRAVVPASKGTCEARLVKSIWKGEDIGGPQCSHFFTSDGRAPTLGGDDVQTVCERTHIRAILTGEAATPFTQRACADYAQAYPEARIRRTCRSVFSGSGSDLTDVQRSLCMAHVGPLAPILPPRRSEPRGSTFATTAAAEEPTGRVWQEGSGGTRWWSAVNTAPKALSATAAELGAVPSTEPIAQRAIEPEPARLPEPVAAAAPAAAPAPEPVVVAPAPVIVAAPVAVAPAPVVVAVPALAPGAVEAPVAAPPDIVTSAQVSAAAVAAVRVAPASRVRCEDNYIESIWKGRDLGSPECAVYVGYDGSTPDYNAGRIASVCLGAETRALRSNVPMTAFTLQACLRVLRTRWSPEVYEAGQSTPGADWNTDPTDTAIRRGLSDASISSTVEASWRSIERDCASVAPLSRSSESAPKTPVVVTLTVGSSGQVRSASASAAGNRELQLCIEGSVRSWSFPQAVGNTVISIPLSFDPRP